MAAAHSISAHLGMTEAIHQVVVDHADGLHLGVDNR
jgi:hypothetical protein